MIQRTIAERVKRVFARKRGIPIGEISDHKLLGEIWPAAWGLLGFEAEFSQMLGIDGLRGELLDGCQINWRTTSVAQLIRILETLDRVANVIAAGTEFPRKEVSARMRLSSFCPKFPQKRKVLRGLHQEFGIQRFPPPVLETVGSLVCYLDRRKQLFAATIAVLQDVLEVGRDPAEGSVDLSKVTEWTLIADVVTESMQRCDMVFRLERRWKVRISHESAATLLEEGKVSVGGVVRFVDKFLCPPGAVP